MRKRVTAPKSTPTPDARPAKSSEAPPDPSRMFVFVDIYLDDTVMSMHRSDVPIVIGPGDGVPLVIERPQER